LEWRGDDSRGISETAETLQERSDEAARRSPAGKRSHGTEINGLNENLKYKKIIIQSPPKNIPAQLKIQPDIINTKPFKRRGCHFENNDKISHLIYLHGVVSLLLRHDYAEEHLVFTHRNSISFIHSNFHHEHFR
jgi:hypothetical protein